MLPHLNRLKKTKEIELIFKKGKGFNGDFIFVKLLKNNGGASRFAFVVGKKTAKKAVDRNRAKRMAREAVRGFLPRIKTGFDVILVIQEKISGADYLKIKNDLKDVLGKAGLFI